MKNNTWTFCLLLLCVGMFSAVPAQEISDKEYQNLLKKNKFNSLYPLVIVEGADEYFEKWQKMMKNSAIPEKYAYLAALSASAALKCEYCIPAQKLLAKKAGATEEEMKITVQIAAEVARFSTLLYGNEWPLPRSK